MCLIHTCKNKAAYDIVAPFLSGKDVGWINRFLSKLDDYSLEELKDYSEETGDKAAIVILEICWDRLKEVM